MNRRLGLALGSAALAVFLLGWAVWALISTTAGLRLAAAALVGWLPPDALALEVAAGSLREGFTLRHARWRSEGFELEANDIAVRLELEPLIGGGVVVQSVSATSARLAWQEGSGMPSRVPQRWRPPLAGELQDLRVAQLEVARAGGARQILEQVQASVVLPATGPLLFDASVRSAGVDATAFGRWGEAAPDALDVEFHWQTVEPATTPARGSGRVWGQGPALRVTHQLVAPLQAALDGTLDLAVDAPHWQVRVTLPEGQRLWWPPEAADVALPALQFDLSGNSFEAWSLAAKAACSLPGVVAARCELQATGTAEQLEVQAFKLTAGKAQLHATGRAQWPQGQLQWQFQADASRFDPALLAREFPGQLDFRLTGEGEARSAALRLSGLSGQLRGRAVAGEGSARVENAALLAANATLRAGQSALTVATGSSERDLLEWRLEVPALGDLLPAAEGQLSAHGTWRGSTQAPVTRGALAASKLAVAGHAVERLSLDWALDARTVDQPLSLRLDARGLRVFDVALSRIEAVVQGTRDRPTLDATLHTRDGTLAVAAQVASTSTGSWQGTLYEGRWQAASGATLALRRPASIRLGPHGAAVTGLCWSGRGELCAEAEVQPDRAWQLQVRATELDLATLVPQAENARLTGQLEASGIARALAQWNGRLQLALPTIQGPGETPLHLDDLTLDLRTSADDLQLALGAAVTAPLRMPLSLSLATRRSADLLDWSHWPLRGALRGEIASLAPLAERSDELAEVDGRAALDLLLSGNLEAPVLAGQATLEVAHAHFTRFGVAITDLQLTARGQPSGRLALAGRFMAGEGRVDVDGLLGVDNGTLAADLHLNGERVQFVDLPEASALVSGALDLHLEPRRASVRGALTVPEASLKLRDRAAATRQSADVVVEGEAAPRAALPALEVALDLTLGKAVALEAGGFSGRLTGNLALAAAPREPLLATGELRIEDGRYTQWGETLALRDSRLLFADRPLGEPRVDARAERIVGDVTAGLRVTGSLREPEGRLYSSPSLPEVDVLSYLVAGQPLSGASSTDARNLLGAAASMGLRGSGLLSQKVASAFGLDTLQVGTRSTARGPALDVGKFISPQLYVGYGAGLLERANTFRLRYLLGKRWSIEAETGSRSGADLLYSIER